MRPHRCQPTRLPCPWDSPGKNTGVVSIWLLVSRVSRAELFSPLFHGLLVYLLCELSNYIFLLYTNGIVCIVCICLFFHLYLSIFSFWCSYAFLLKAKKNFIFVFLTPFFNEDFYSIILIVIIDKPEFISAILLHAFLFFL